MRDVVCVIPARLQSTRLPEKPLQVIEGKTMIRRTFERAATALGADSVFVATDSDKIASECQQFTNQVVMTSPNCLTGTDRVAEFAEQVAARTYLNLQGDEPLMALSNISAIRDAAVKNRSSIINGYAKITSEAEFYSTSIPKVVFSQASGRLQYMSRAPIPGNKKGIFGCAHKQICIYSFSREHLAKYRAWGSKSPNELVEDIEILRFIDHDVPVHMIALDANTVAVDLPSDLERVRRIVAEQGDSLSAYRI